MSALTGSEQKVAYPIRVSPGSLDRPALRRRQCGAALRRQCPLLATTPPAGWGEKSRSQALPRLLTRALKILRFFLLSNSPFSD